MATKPSLSPTKLTNYLACPVKYRWTYIDDRGRWLMRAKSCYSFGSTLHKVLQRFHDGGDIGVTTTEEVLAAYEDSWIEAGFNSAEEMAEAFGEGKQILERHVEQARHQSDGAKTLFVEKQFRHDMGSFFLSGRIDRVDEYPDGTLEVVDYKSGRESVCTEDLLSDIAMSCYQFLLTKHYPDRPVRARIVALRGGVSATCAVTLEEHEQFERDLRELGGIILSEEYHELTPVLKPVCLRCDFLPLCKRHEDFAESLLALEHSRLASDDCVSHST